MARYHFTIVDGRASQDVDGVECLTVGHARREAVRQVGHLLMTQPARFWDNGTWTLEASRPGVGPVFNLNFQAESIIPDEWLD